MSRLMEQFGVAEAAQQQYALRVQGLPDDAFTVKAFRSDALELSGDYTVTVDALATVEPADLAEVIDRTATLAMRWHGGERPLHGVVAGITHTGAEADGEGFRVVLRSPLHVLARRRGSRVFLGRTVSQIAKEVLGDAGLAREAVRFEVTTEPPAREFVVQYEESDLAFLERQFAYHGLFFAFVQEPDRATLLVTDATASLAGALEPVTLDYQPLTGGARTATTLYEWRTVGERTVRGVHLDDYNPEAPRRALGVSAGEGEADHRWGEHFGDRREGERLAAVRREAHAWAVYRAEAATDCRAVRPGTRVSVAGHPDPSVDGDWIVVAADIAGDQRSGLSYGDASGEPGFEARLELIPASVPYRPRRAATTHRVHGVFTARVEGDGGDYAYLDDQGRYRIRLGFDLGDRPDAEASHPVRLAQPYGGADHGLHFPLHHGTEVIVSCVNGDVDRPIILGAMFNADTPSPVNGANASQNVLRTWGGNELLMEDRRGEERIELFTRERRNRLALDAREAGHEVRLESEEGDATLRAGRHMRCEAGRDHHTEVGGSHSASVEKDYRLLTRKGDIECRAAEDISFKAGRDLHLEAVNADLTARAGGDVTVASGGDLAVNVRRRDATVRVDKGGIAVQAAGEITLRGSGGGAIRIGQSGGTIEITADGRLAIDAPSVEISGGSIAIKGQTLGNN